VFSGSRDVSPEIGSPQAETAGASLPDEGCRVSTNVKAKPRRRRVAVVAAGTLAVSTLAALGPSQVTVVAYAASSATVSPAYSSAAKAGALAASGSSSVGSSATQRAGAVTSTPTRAPSKVATLAPYRFGTKAYNQWWARRLMARHGWTSGVQFRALVKLWDRESLWNHRSHNSGSGAHGIPQALPGSKMRSAGADWRTNPVTQIKWGLNYIHSRYGSPTKAWAHFLRHHWY
jgi:hypothetical protein